MCSLSSSSVELEWTGDGEDWDGWKASRMKSAGWSNSIGCRTCLSTSYMIMLYDFPRGLEEAGFILPFICLSVPSCQGSVVWKRVFIWTVIHSAEFQSHQHQKTQKWDYLSSIFQSKFFLLVSPLLKQKQLGIYVAVSSSQRVLKLVNLSFIFFGRAHLVVLRADSW